MNTPVNTNQPYQAASKAYSQSASQALCSGSPRPISVAIAGYFTRYSGNSRVKVPRMSSGEVSTKTLTIRNRANSVL